MIVTEKRDPGLLLEELTPYSRVFILGCGDCATSCKTGGLDEVKELSRLLTEQGKEVTGYDICETACDLRLLKQTRKKNREAVERSEAIVVTACGAGLGSLRELLQKPLVPGVESRFLGSMERLGTFREYCALCGDCTVGQTFGYCTYTRCAKGLLNGPCGSSVDGKCEVSPEKECVWVLIYEYLKEEGRLDELLDIDIRKDHCDAKSINIVRGYKPAGASRD